MQKEERAEFINWFKENCFAPNIPPAVELETEPEEVVSVEQLLDFFKLQKLHRRSFLYPTYYDLMKEIEKLGVTNRQLTKNNLLDLLPIWKVCPKIRHELNLALQVFDTEERGFLDLEEIQLILTEYDDPMSQEEVDEFLRDFNSKGDGNINIIDFLETTFRVYPELYQLQTDYLYEDPEEDPSVPPLPLSEPDVQEPQAETEAEPPPPKRGKKGKGGKGAKGGKKKKK